MIKLFIGSQGFAVHDVSSRITLKPCPVCRPGKHVRNHVLHVYFRCDTLLSGPKVIVMLPPIQESGANFCLYSRNCLVRYVILRQNRIALIPRHEFLLHCVFSQDFSPRTLVRGLFIAFRAYYHGKKLSLCYPRFKNRGLIFFSSLPLFGRFLHIPFRIRRPCCQS